MADSTFSVRVITPAGIMLEDESNAVSVVGADGQVGILGQHVRYTGVLGTGILKLMLISGEERKFVISGGFCNFTNNMLIILADRAELPSNINRDSLPKERSELEAALAEGDSQSPQWLEARSKLSRIEAVEELFAR